MFRRSKYNNRKVTIDGYCFDSIAESRRYGELKILMNAKEKENRVVKIEMQPEFILIPRWQEKIKGKVKTHRARKYVADFRITYADGRVEIEDVKGMLTSVYKLKRDMLLYLFREDSSFIFREILS